MYFPYVPLAPTGGDFLHQYPSFYSALPTSQTPTGKANLRVTVKTAYQFKYVI